MMTRNPHLLQATPWFTICSSKGDAATGCGRWSTTAPPPSTPTMCSSPAGDRFPLRLQYQLPDRQRRYPRHLYRERDHPLRHGVHAVSPHGFRQDPLCTQAPADRGASRRKGPTLWMRKGGASSSITTNGANWRARDIGGPAIFDYKAAGPGLEVYLDFSMFEEEWFHGRFPQISKTFEALGYRSPETGCRFRRRSLRQRRDPLDSWGRIPGMEGTLCWPGEAADRSPRGQTAWLPIPLLGSGGPFGQNGRGGEPWAGGSHGRTGGPRVGKVPNNGGSPKGGRAKRVSKTRVGPGHFGKDWGGQPRPEGGVVWRPKFLFAVAKTGSGGLGWGPKHGGGHLWRGALGPEKGFGGRTN